VSTLRLCNSGVVKTDRSNHPAGTALRQFAGLLLAMLCVWPLLRSIFSSIRSDLPVSSTEEVSSAVIPAQGPHFAMAVIIDHRGNLWAGSEDEGTWECVAPDGEWRQFTTKDGLGDNCGYALAEDRLGRIWVGHLNHGVSVYNGRCWQTYETVAGLSRPDTLSGPIGQRVFAIGVCPTDGDVWIATDRGLSRYSEGHDSWTYYTRMEGLPTDSIRALAFDKQGNIYCATQYAGIIVSKAINEYARWDQVKGPYQLPCTAAGSGLPSNLVNDVFVSREGLVFAATDAGLAWSCDKGSTWLYARGQNYAAKVDLPPVLRRAG
jgi:hypothetical protein